ncbi:excinuclease ABC subunit UvrA [bacterium]|nr:excinuclease ABC subunit UvrA [bacterium]
MSSAKQQNLANTLILRGVRENNLKELNLEIPHNTFVAITGVSGSGKSTLAFDTIYAEGARRYIETFSPYTRQFLDRLHQPDLDSMSGVRPALALEQRNRINNSRSTVGSVTEINDYLKVVFAEFSTAYCESCQREVKIHTPASAAGHVIDQLEKEKTVLLAIGFNIDLKSFSNIEAIKNALQLQGYSRFFYVTQKEILSIDQIDNSNFRLESKKITVIASRYPQPKAQDLTLIRNSIAEAYKLGHNQAQLFYAQEKASWHIENISQIARCESCEQIFQNAKPSLFSFNSPLGACPECKGFGHVLVIDPKRCVPNTTLSIAEGAFACWSSPATRREFSALKKFCAEQKISITTPWHELTTAQRELIFNATRKAHGFRGIYAWFKMLERKKYKMHVRVFLSRYRTQELCPSCNGSRLTSTAAAYRLAGMPIGALWKLSIQELQQWITRLVLPLTISDTVRSAHAEVSSRLSYLLDVGLHYLTLDRQSRTLSGGEMQRVNLTALLGSRLTNSTLVLDEPSIGLHATDSAKLIEVIKNLRKRNNTVFVVEHDTEIIKAADHVIDLGPKSGLHGGEVVFQGSPEDLACEKKSLTGQYLDSTVILADAALSQAQSEQLKIKGASAHNLKNISLSIPLQQLIAVAGVSGSGKSTLLYDCLYEPVRSLRAGEILEISKTTTGNKVSQISGYEIFSEIVLVDQSPVGNTPRSNAATYTKAWDIIRECFAASQDAIKHGLNKSAFSFNVDGGRCPICKGAGQLKIEMQFLADVFVECERCQGKRFREIVLGIKLGGKSIEDILRLPLAEVPEFFKSAVEIESAQAISKLINPLLELGLGYLTVGQPLNSLSGGEAQRVKLASYLAQTQADPILFILDEPTTGLHPHDVKNLIQALRTLVNYGHSVICIEHNLQLIGASDYLIELGPGGGASGGELLVADNLHKLLRSTVNTKTLEILRRGTQQSKLQAKKLSEKISTKALAKQITQTATELTVTGAQHHNLKNISVKIPTNKLNVITGPSGSGKSSLAFDIIFSEGQRRYIDCLSPYARQFLTQLTRPEVDFIDNIPPTIAISQKTAPPLGITTIATTTELYQYLRLLFAKVGTQHCPTHLQPIVTTSAQAIAEELVRNNCNERIFLFAPVVLGRKGHYAELFARSLRADITAAKIDGKVQSISEGLRLDRHKVHWVSLLLAQLKVNDCDLELLTQAIEQCLALGNGSIEIACGDKHASTSTRSLDRSCPVCKKGFLPPDPLLFSFRSRRGMCLTCEGRGKIEKRRSEVVCPDCAGQRLNAEALAVKIDQKNIHQFVSLSAPELYQQIKNLKFDARLKTITDPIIFELLSRLKLISDIGLDYLALDRESSTLSGGEAQRLRLARALGSPLSGVCYVLDEPTIGLHLEDHVKLLETLRKLRDQGNTLLIVEHDEETIRNADYIIDMGPGGGAEGGEIIATGSFKQILSSQTSPTATAIRKRMNTGSELSSRPSKQKNSQVKHPLTLDISGATANNLKNIDLSIPLNCFTVVCGVSGAGKSSLVHESLVKYYHKQGKGFDTLTIAGLDKIDALVEIDQSPPGKSSSSVPASYLGIFDQIRSVFALTPDAQAQGLKASAFSFNNKVGQCPQCKGRGSLKVPMSFLPDAITLCEACNGRRYNPAICDIRFKGFSIADVLSKTCREAIEIFENFPKIHTTLKYVEKLGLGYLTLGQPTATLSGGEAQRLKIVRELSTRSTNHTLYILDEPTTGLHMQDVERLNRVLKDLVEKGNSVLVIEHDLDLIRAADHIIELGPGPGDAGGRVIFEGTLAKLLTHKIKTPTQKALLPSPRATKSGLGNQHAAQSDAIAQ